MKNFKLWILILLVLIVVVVVGIFVLIKNMVPQDLDKQLKKVVVQASWVIDAELAPITSAIKQGYYADEGLEIVLRPGGIQGTAFLDGTVLLSQDDTIDIAIANDMTTQILAKDKGDFYVKSIGAIWQINPSGLLVKADKNIKNLKDIASYPNFRIGFGGDNWIVKAIADYIGVEQSHFKEIVVGGDATAFLTDQVDGLLCYWTTQAYEAELAGVDYDFIPLSTMPGYSNPSLVVQAREQTIEQDPDMLEAFMRATIKGAQYVANNSKDAAMSVISSELGTLDLSVDHQKWMINKSLELKLLNYEYDNSKYLMLNETQIKDYLAWLYKYKQIENEHDINNEIDLSILNKIYK